MKHNNLKFGYYLNLFSSTWNFMLFLNAGSLWTAHLWFALSLLGFLSAWYLGCVHYMLTHPEEMEEEEA